MSVLSAVVDAECENSQYLAFTRPTFSQANRQHRPKMLACEGALLHSPPDGGAAERHLAEVEIGVKILTTRIRVST